MGSVRGAREVLRHVMRWQHKRQRLSILLSITLPSLCPTPEHRVGVLVPFDMLSDGNAVPMAAVAPEPGALELQTLAEAAL